MLSPRLRRTLPYVVLGVIFLGLVLYTIFQPEDLLTPTWKNMRALQGYHFVLTLEVNNTQVIEQFADLKNQEGDVARPGNFYVKVTSSPRSYEMLERDNIFYTRMSGQAWLPLSGAFPADSSNWQGMSLSMIKAVNELTTESLGRLGTVQDKGMEDVTLDGGTTQSSRPMRLHRFDYTGGDGNTPDAEHGSIYLDPSTKWVYYMTYYAPVNEGTMGMKVTLSKHGEPVTLPTP